MRGVLLVVALGAITGVGVGCKKGVGGGKPFMQRELAAQHVTIQDVEYDLALPKGVTPDPSKGNETHWLASADDTLDVRVSLVTPVVMQNALNFEDQAGHRVSRSEAAADGGWVITAADASGGVVMNRRMVVKNGRALDCQATMNWKTPGHDQKRTDWVEAICQSLVPSKFN